jgi:hypothetical protein
LLLPKSIVVYNGDGASAPANQGPAVERAGPQSGANDLAFVDPAL